MPVGLYLPEFLVFDKDQVTVKTMCKIMPNEDTMNHGYSTEVLLGPEMAALPANVQPLIKEKLVRPED